MKRILIAAGIAIPLLCAVGLAIRCDAQAKKRDRAEWKQIGDSIDATMEGTIRTLEELPKIGK